MKRAPSAGGMGGLAGGGSHPGWDKQTFPGFGSHPPFSLISKMTQLLCGAENLRVICARGTKQLFDRPPNDNSTMSNRLPLDLPGLEAEFGRVEVRRSARRKKTVSAEIVGEALVVLVPERMSRAEEQQWVTTLASRMFERQRRDRLNSDDNLARRAGELADLYLDGVRPTEISWVTTQRSRWGSCSVEDGSIRLSLALADYPAWVRDYVIVHELAHLRVADHSDEFWALVNRYPLTERARGFLLAKGLEEG